MGKYGIFINDDEDAVWESDAEANVVDQVTVTNARGEVTVVGSPGQDTWLRIRVSERPQVNTYLDLIEQEKLQERRDRFEVEAEGIGTDAHVLAEEEDSELETTPMSPTPETGPTSQEDQDNEKAMAGDVEF
jgi:hypothetical protein